MSIVRSLLIKIGFSTDRQSVGRAEKTVSTFKRKSLLAASAITYAFSRVANYFHDFASNILDTENFSKYVGVAIEDLYALQKAAQKVARIEEKDFQNAIANIQKMFRDLRIGASGELQLIADQMGFKIDRINDNGVSLFNKILVALSTVEDEAERSAIAENIFKSGDFKKFAELAGNMQQFADATKSFRESASGISSQIDPLKKYTEAVNELTESWHKFVIEISDYVIPVLLFLTKHLTRVFDQVSGVIDFYKGAFTLDSSTFLKGVDKISKSLDPLFEGTILGDTQNFFKRLWSGELTQPIVDYIENRPGYVSPGQAMLVPNITVNNEISVPVGTTEEQAKMMADTIKQSVDDSIDTVFRNIQYNNPVIE